MLALFKETTKPLDTLIANLKEGQKSISLPTKVRKQMEGELAQAVEHKNTAFKAACAQQEWASHIDKATEIIESMTDWLAKLQKNADFFAQAEKSVRQTHSLQNKISAISEFLDRQPKQSKQIEKSQKQLNEVMQILNSVSLATDNWIRKALLLEDVSDAAAQFASADKMATHANVLVTQLEKTYRLKALVKGTPEANAVEQQLYGRVTRPESESESEDEEDEQIPTVRVPIEPLSTPFTFAEHKKTTSKDADFYLQKQTEMMDVCLKVEQAIESVSPALRNGITTDVCVLKKNVEGHKKAFVANAQENKKVGVIKALQAFKEEVELFQKNMQEMEDILTEGDVCANKISQIKSTIQDAAQLQPDNWNAEIKIVEMAQYLSQGMVFLPYARNSLKNLKMSLQVTQEYVDLRNRVCNIKAMDGVCSEDFSRVKDYATEQDVQKIEKLNLQYKQNIEVMLEKEKIAREKYIGTDHMVQYVKNQQSVLEKKQAIVCVCQKRMDDAIVAQMAKLPLPAAVVLSTPTKKPKKKLPPFSFTEWDRFWEQHPKEKAELEAFRAEQEAKKEQRAIRLAQKKKLQNQSPQEEVPIMSKPKKPVLTTWAQMVAPAAAPSAEPTPAPKAKTWASLFSN